MSKLALIELMTSNVLFYLSSVFNNTINRDDRNAIKHAIFKMN